VIFPKQHGVASQVSQHLDDISACDAPERLSRTSKVLWITPDRAPFERFRRLRIGVSAGCDDRL